MRIIVGKASSASLETQFWYYQQESLLWWGWALIPKYSVDMPRYISIGKWVPCREVGVGLHQETGPLIASSWFCSTGTMSILRCQKMLAIFSNSWKATNSYFPKQRTFPRIFFLVLHSLHISHSTWATMSYHLLFDSVAVTFLSITSLGFSKLSISHRSGYFVFLNLLTSHCVVRCPTYIRYSTPCSLCWLRWLLPV